MLTPERLAAVYDCLRQFPPFNRYGLPPSSEVKFGFIRDTITAADYIAYVRDYDSHLIRFNPHFNGHLNTVMERMAHEMIHLHQRIRRHETNAMHNADFKRKARRICQIYGWDFKRFV